VGEGQVVEPTQSVLVVDDDPEVLAALTRALQAEGLTVRAALDAEQALQQLAAGDVAHVIVDFQMRGPNGAWLLRQVRERHAGVRRILLSGLPYTELARHLEPGLVDVFLEKPVDIEDIVAALQDDEQA
jgi:ActR/RegA family two-component response regulator